MNIKFELWQVLIILCVIFLAVTVYMQKTQMGKLCNNFCELKFGDEIKGSDTGTFGMGCRCLIPSSLGHNFNFSYVFNKTNNSKIKNKP